MSTAEAKMLITAEDHASGPLEKIQQRFKALLAPIENIKSSLNGISGGGLSKVGGALDGLKGKLAGIGLATGAAVTGVMAIKGAFKAVDETAEKAFDLKNLAARFQIGTEELQVMQKVAKETGATTEELALAYSQLKRRMGDAMGDPAKAEAMGKVFAQLGMTMKEAQSMGATDLFSKIGRTFAEATGVQQDGAIKEDVDKASELKESIAKNLFGRAGTQDLAGIEKFGTGYKEVLKTMTDAGLLMSPAMIAMGAHAHESIEKSKGAMKGLQLMFGMEMMPVFDEFARVMKERMIANRTALAPGVHALAAVLSTAIKPFLDDMDKMANKASGLFNVIAKFAKLVGWDNLVFGTLALIIAPFVVSIIGATVAIAGLVVSMGVSTIVTISKFSTSLLKSGEAATASNALFAAASGPLATLRAAFFGASVGIRAMSLALLTNPLVWIIAGIAVAAYLIYDNWAGISSFFSGMWDSIATGLEGLSAVFGPTWDAIRSSVAPIFDWFKSSFSDSANGMQDWSSAGISSGHELMEMLKALMTPITLLIDAFNLLSIADDFMAGKDVKFKSATAELLKDKPNETVESVKAGRVLRIAGENENAALLRKSQTQLSEAVKPAEEKAEAPLAVAKKALKPATEATKESDHVKDLKAVIEAAKPKEDAPITAAKAALEVAKPKAIAHAEETGNPHSRTPGAAPEIGSRMQPIVTQKIDFAGKVDINIKSNVPADVGGMTSSNPAVKMTANTGSMNGSW